MTHYISTTLFVCVRLCLCVLSCLFLYCTFTRRSLLHALWAYALAGVYVFLYVCALCVLFQHYPHMEDALGYGVIYSDSCEGHLGFFLQNLGDVSGIVSVGIVSVWYAVLVMLLWV